MTADVKELEISDFELRNNIKASFIYLWRMKAVVILPSNMTFERLQG